MQTSNCRPANSRSRALPLSACLLFVFFASPLFADSSCVKHEEHESTTVLLVDKSDPIKDQEKFEQSLKAIREMLRPAERFVVAVSTGSLAGSRVVADVVFPKGSLWESRMKTKAREKQFDHCFEQAQQQVLQPEEPYKTSALLETLQFVSDILSAEKDIPKRVVLYSDMVQNSSSLSFYSGASINVEPALKQAKSEALVWNFKGVEFYVAGIGSGGSDKKDRQLRQFWQAYFEAAGGVLKAYGPVLLAQG